MSPVRDLDARTRCLQALAAFAANCKDAAGAAAADPQKPEDAKNTCNSDRREPQKSERLKLWLAEVIAEHEVVISTQVWIELRSVASRKRQPPLPATEIATMLAALSGFKVVRTEPTSCSMS